MMEDLNISVPLHRKGSEEVFISIEKLVFLLNMIPPDMARYDQELIHHGPSRAELYQLLPEIEI